MYARSNSSQVALVTFSIGWHSEPSGVIVGVTAVSQGENELPSGDGKGRQLKLGEKVAEKIIRKRIGLV